MTAKTKAELEAELAHAQARLADLERLTLENRILREMANLMAAGPTVESVAESIYHYASQIMDTTNFFVALYEEEAQELYFVLDVVEGKREDRGPTTRRPLRRGLTEYIIRTRQPLLMEEDIDGHRQRLGLEAVGKLGAKSWLGVPMLLGDKVIGVIAVQSYTMPRTYNTWHRDVLSAIASQAAIAIQNARLFQQRERQLAEFRVLNQIGQTLASTLDVDVLVETVYTWIGQLFDTSSFYIATYQPETRTWTMVFNVENGQRMPVTSHSVEVGLTGYIIRARESVLLRSAEQYRAFCAERNIEVLGGEALSWMGVPLLAGDEVVGVMGIENLNQENAYTTRDLELFRTIAAQAASVLRNALLYQQTRRALVENATLYRISNALLSSEDVNLQLREVVQGVLNVVAAEGAALLTLDRVRQTPLQLVGAGTLGALSLEAARSWLQGVHGQALAKRVPFFLSPGVTDERLTPEEQRLCTAGKALAIVPLHYRGVSLGTLTVTHKHPAQEFSPRERELLQSLANQAVVSLNTAYLLRERERRLSELTVVNEIGQALTGTLEMERLLEMVHRQLGRLFDVENFYIALYNEGEQTWTRAYGIEHGQRQPVESFPITRGVTGYIIRTRRPVLLRTSMERDAFLTQLNIPPVGELALSWMGVPLIASGRVVGVMAIQNYEQEYVYDESSLDLLKTVAAQVANTIQNVRLFREIQQRVEHEYRMRMLTERLRRAADTESLLAITLEELGRLLNAPVGVVRLGTRESLREALALSADKDTE